MGQFTPDGGWTSNKGKHYGPNDRFTDDADSQENAADNAAGLNAGPFGDNTTQPNTITGNRIGSNAPGAQLDTSQADAQRNQTGDLIAQLQQQAATGHGSWEGALKAATSRSVNTASAVGQSNPNSSYGSALESIGNAQAGAKQRAVGQADVLRNESELDAQDQLQGLLSAQGGQDIDQSVAQSNARAGLRSINLTLKQQATKTAGDYGSGVGQAAGAASKMSDGGGVPGQPQVFGDDEKNDTVPAMLSPGEVVIPRSIAHDPEAAADFVRAVNASKARSGGAQHMADGGEADPYTAERNRAWKPGDVDPTGPHSGSFDTFGAFGDVQAPTVQNGGILDTTQLDKTRGAGLLLTDMLSKRSTGEGPSTVGQGITNANDSAIAQAMAAQRQGAGAAAVTGGATRETQGAAGEAGAAKGKEQSAGQAALGHRLSTARGQELSLAQAQQQAAIRNTMTNLGIGVEQQAGMRALFSGAGQAASAFSGAGAGERSPPGIAGTSNQSAWDSGELSDMSGGTGGPADLNAGDTDFKAFGGAVQKLAGGGRLRGKAVAPRETDAEESEPDHDPEAPSLTSRLSEFARSLGASAYGSANAATQSLRGAEPEAQTHTNPHQPRLRPPHSAEPLDHPEDLHIQRAFGGAVPGYAEGGDIMALEGRRDLGQQVVTTESGIETPTGVPLQTTENGAERDIMRAPQGYDRLLGPSLSAPAIVARHGADEAARPLPKGVRPAGGGFTADEHSDAVAPVVAKPKGGSGTGIALPAQEDRSALETAEVDRVKAESELEARAARAEALGAAEKQRVSQDYALEEKQRRDTAAMRTNDAFTRLQSAQEEFNRIDANVDPGRYWASRSTGQKILGIIGLALGAAGTGPDGINRSAQMMNQAIDRDIEAQKAQYEARLRKGTAKVAAAQSYYAMARESGLDEVAATHAAKAAALDAVASKTEATVMGIKEPMVKLKGEGLANAIRGGAADKRDKAKQQTFEDNIQRGQLGVAQAHLDVAREAAGKKGGLSESERKTVGDVTAASKDALGLIDNIEKTLGRTQSIVPWKTTLNQHIGSDSATLDTDTASLVAKMKDINKLGQIGPADKALLEEAIGDPKAVFTLEGTKRAKLERVKQIIKDSVANERSARGLQ